MKEKDTVEVIVFDETHETVLKLWEALVGSAATWKPSHTVLLLSNPGYRGDYKGSLSINAETIVDVDPAMYDADWLRRHAQKLAKRDHVNPPFPENSMRLMTQVSLLQCSC